MNTFLIDLYNVNYVIDLLTCPKSTSVIYRPTVGIELGSPDSHPTLLTTRHTDICIPSLLLDWTTHCQPCILKILLQNYERSNEILQF